MNRQDVMELIAQRSANTREHCALGWLDLKEADLEGADLSGLTFIHIDFTGANLKNASLSKADLRYVNLNNANLESANLSQVKLHNATCHGISLRHADLSRASVHSCEFHNANLEDAEFYKATLAYSRFVKANFTRAGLVYATAYGSTFTLCDLSYAKVTNTCFDDGAFEGTTYAGYLLTAAPITIAGLKCDTTILATTAGLFIRVGRCLIHSIAWYEPITAKEAREKWGTDGEEMYKHKKGILALAKSYEKSVAKYLPKPK